VVDIVLPNAVAEISSSEVVEQTGIHIVSDFPISVSAMNLRVATTDATVVLPLKNIPVNATYVSGHPSKKYKTFSFGSTNEFLLVSPENNVQVEITPTGKTLKSRPADSTFIISLDQGETFQVQSSENLDGSTIKVLNGKKIVVYSGDRCSNFPSGACDHQVEQLFPNQLLDSVYYTLPQFGHTNGYIVKVISIDGPITIDVNGVPYSIMAKNQPLLFDIPKEDSVLRISGPRNFSVFQFLKGATGNSFTNSNGYVTKGWGDPAILQVLSAKFMGQKSTFSTVNSGNLKDHFVTIMIPTLAKNNVYLDNSLLSPTEFTEIPIDKSLSYAKIKLSLGTHTIVCANGHLAYCYGIGSYESYLYAAGFSLPNFDISINDTALIYNCKDNTITMRFEAKLEGAIKSYHWDFGDGSPTDTTKIVTHVYKANKDFTIKLWAIGVNDKTDSVVKKYNFSWPEFNPVFDKLLCDPTYKFKETNPFFTNFKWHDNSTGDSFIANKTEQIWVSATDTSGYCKFYDTAQISKIDVLSKIFVDTLSNCYLNNEFKFTDSSGVKGDLIKSKVWTFPGGVNLYDTSNFTYRFKTAGDLKVYLDIYPANAECKARIEIPVKVNWSTDIDGFINKEKFCDGEELIFKDNSYSCCQPVTKYYWQVPGDSLYTSTSGIFNVKARYDYIKSEGIRRFNFVTETAQGCRDTFKSDYIVWPKALAKFDFGADSVKCLSISRWTFTHTIDEDISGPYKMFWDFGNGTTGTQNEYKNMRYFDTGAYTIKLVTTSDIGCLDSLSKKVYVIGNTVTDFNLKDSIQCFVNHAFEVIDSSKGVQLSYLWNFGNGKTSNNALPGMIKYDSSGIYKIILKTTSSNPSCPSDSVIHYAVVLKSPKADFDLSADSVCFNNNIVTATNTSKVYNGKNKYYWQYLNTLDSLENPAVISIQTTGKHKIVLTVKDGSNCMDSISKFISVFANSNLQLAINDSVQCFGKNQFVIAAQASEKINSYQWYLEDVLTDNQPIFSLADVATSGKKKISLVVINDFNCIDSISNWIRVLPSFKADFNINKDTQCLANNSFDFTDNSNPPLDDVVKQTYSENTIVLGNGKELKGQNYAAAGSHEISYFIETKNACKDSILKFIYIIEEPTAIFESDSVCIGQSIQLKGIQNTGAPIFSWQWQMGDGQSTSGNSVVYQYKNTGVFIPELRVTDRFGCFAIVKGTNQIYPLPNANFKYSVVGSIDQFTQVQLIPSQSGFPKYNWFSPTDLLSSEESPLVNLPKIFNDSIHLVVQSAFGCESRKSVYLYVYPPLDKLFIPNAFTPDGNGQNDHFKPGNIEGATDYTLTIINRWGEILFVSHNPKEGWDGKYQGKNVQDGIYVFTVSFLYSDGRLYSEKGTVHLLR
jgi:gliding motility-associated-like protein